jgi:hypothetical protein
VHLSVATYSPDLLVGHSLDIPQKLAHDSSIRSQLIAQYLLREKDIIDEDALIRSALYMDYERNRIRRDSDRVE